jgi:hypothetical protein
VRLLDAAVGTYRPQYHPLPAFCYLDVNPLPTRYTLFITLDQVWILFLSLVALYVHPDPKGSWSRYRVRIYAVGMVFSDRWDLRLVVKRGTRGDILGSGPSL